MVRNRLQVDAVRTPSDLSRCLAAQVRMLLESAEWLVQSSQAEPELRNALIARISHKEQEADELLHAIHQAPTVVEKWHPRGPELRRVAEACERVLDRLEDTACWIANSSLASTPGEFIAACSLVRRCVELISLGVSCLDDAARLAWLSGQIRAVRKLAETTTREARGHFFANETSHVIDMVRIRELYSLLERTIDELKGVADAFSQLSNTA